MKYKNNIIFYFPSIENGGVEKNFFLLIDYFKSKCNLFIITSSKIKLKHENLKIISPKKKFFYQLPRCLKNIVCFFLFIISKPKNAKILSFQYNITAIILAKITNSLIIIRSNQSPEFYSKNFIKTKLYQFIFKFADKIIVNSFQFQKNFTKKFKVKCHVIYNLIDSMSAIKKLKNKTKLKIYDNNKVSFIIIGRLVRQKNHLFALKAFKKIDKKKFELILLGSGNEENKIKYFINQNNLNSNVKIIKYKKNIYPYLNGADILLLTSIYEGLPNVLIEGLMLKKIIISSDCDTGPKEILEYGKYGFLYKSGDAEDLYNKINYCINNIKKCKKSRKINYGYNSLVRFDKNANSEKYFKLLKNL